MTLKYIYQVNKLCFYDGKSVLDNLDILGFLYYGNNTNSKVKHYHYTVYIPKNIEEKTHSPGVCGDCPLLKEKFCYTMSHMALAYYKWRQNYLNGNIKLIEDFKDIKKWLRDTSLYGLRLGMHGDPASVPYEITERLLNVYKPRIIGYTHQQTHDNYDSRYNFLLQSTEKIEEAQSWNARELKTARIINHPSKALKSEVICPYDLAKYNRLQEATSIVCGTCQLCSLNSKASIAFLPKGNIGKKPKLSNYIERVNQQTTQVLDRQLAFD